MNRKVTSFCLAASLFPAGGCSKKAAFPSYMDSERLGSARATRALQLKAMAEGSHRFIAVRHKLEILSSEASLSKSFESILNFCATIQCEVTASSITARTRESSPSASIALRVRPQDFEKLFAQAEKQGNIVQHTTETEDQTSAVVDTEGKLKNLTAYRDSLRTMLGKSAVSVKDLVELQEKLADVQSRLDSETATRKILANETEKVAVELNFRVERSGTSRSAFTPIWDAIRESGANLAESLAVLIMVVVAIIPWLVVIVPAIWLLTKFWGKFRRKPNVSAPSPSA